MQTRRARAPVRYDQATMAHGARVKHVSDLGANPGKLTRMAKRKTTTTKPKQRPRAEIDRNYFFGDVLRKTSGAVWVALFMIALFTPFNLMGAIHQGMWDYLTVMGLFAAIGGVCYFTGTHLRREATHWEFD